MVIIFPYHIHNFTGVKRQDKHEVLHLDGIKVLTALDESKSYQQIKQNMLSSGM